MIIDWFTVGAQLFNFSILVWLMKRFLYHPILNAIETREKNIVLELKNADKKKAQAQNQHDEFQKKNEEFDHLRVELLSKMNEEVQVERHRLIEEVRENANDLRAKREVSLKNSADKFYKSIKHKTEKEVFEIARKVISDLSTSNLEKSICQKFILRLKELSKDEKKDFIVSNQIFIRTSFVIPDDQKSFIQNSINESFQSNISLKYVIAPDLIGGIELMSNGKKISWSINEYLSSMEQSLFKDLSYEY